MFYYLGFWPGLMKTHWKGIQFMFYVCRNSMTKSLNSHLTWSLISLKLYVLSLFYLDPLKMNERTLSVRWVYVCRDPVTYHFNLLIHFIFLSECEIVSSLSKFICSVNFELISIFLLVPLPGVDEGYVGAHWERDRLSQLF